MKIGNTQDRTFPFDLTWSHTAGRQGEPGPGWPPPSSSRRSSSDDTQARPAPPLATGQAGDGEIYRIIDFILLIISSWKWCGADCLAGRKRLGTNATFQEKTSEMNWTKTFTTEWQVQITFLVAKNNSSWPLLHLHLLATWGFPALFSIEVISFLFSILRVARLISACCIVMKITKAPVSLLSAGGIKNEILILESEELPFPPAPALSLTYSRVRTQFSFKRTG